MSPEARAKVSGLESVPQPCEHCEALARSVSDLESENQSLLLRLAEERQRAQVFLRAFSPQASGLPGDPEHEQPLRYRLVDAVNTVLKTSGRPMHRVIRRFARAWVNKR